MASDCEASIASFIARIGTTPIYWMTWNKSCGTAFARGICSSGMGLAWKSLRQGTASQRAQELARFCRALSVAIPVLAYIWRYSLEIKTKARRARRFGVQRDRFHTEAKL